MADLIVKSSAFENNKTLPIKYSCDGDEVNPPLTLEGVPPDAKSIALIVEDPDAARTFDHWIVWNIPITNIIAENSVPGIEGRNSSGDHAYVSPCPPSGTHRYFFKVFALNAKLDLTSNAGKKDLMNAMQGHILAKGELVGLYSRK